MGMNEHTTINPTTGTDDALNERRARNAAFFAELDKKNKEPRTPNWSDKVDLAPIRHTR